MSLKDQINNDLKQAMKNKDKVALRGLRAIKSAILLAETSEGASGELSADEELKLLMKQAKQRKDSIAQFQENGREDLVQKEQEELEVIESYLPKQLPPEEVEAIVKAIIDETGASSVKDMGKVMGMATKKIAGQADNQLISEIAKKILLG